MAMLAGLALGRFGLTHAILTAAMRRMMSLKMPFGRLQAHVDAVAKIGKSVWAVVNGQFWEKRFKISVIRLSGGVVCR